jgi:hypothetical protein
MRPGLLPLWFEGVGPAYQGYLSILKVQLDHSPKMGGFGFPDVSVD